MRSSLQTVSLWEGRGNGNGNRDARPPETEENWGHVDEVTYRNDNRKDTIGGNEAGQAVAASRLMVTSIDNLASGYWSWYGNDDRSDGVEDATFIS